MSRSKSKLTLIDLDEFRYINDNGLMMDVSVWSDNEIAYTYYFITGHRSVIFVTL